MRARLWRAIRLRSLAVKKDVLGNGGETNYNRCATVRSLMAMWRVVANNAVYDGACVLDLFDGFREKG